MRAFNLRKLGRGNNGHALTLGPLTVYFSYATPVAFHYEGRGSLFRRNEWGPTTGRHMNAAHAETDGGHSTPVDGDAFEVALLSAMAGTWRAREAFQAMHAKRIAEDVARETAPTVDDFNAAKPVRGSV